MHLSDYIQSDLVFGALNSKSKDDLIHEISDKICNVRHELNSKKVADILIERERLSSTGIENGIAIPHGRVPGLKKVLVACGRKKDGVTFDSHDGKPSQLFFVLLTPEQADATHLKVLARLSRLLKDEQFKKHLLDAQDSHELFETIIKEDKK